jgi:dienelactone hydrolase
MRKRRLIAWILVGLAVLGGAIGVAVYRAIGTFPVPIPATLKGEQGGALVALERTGKYPAFVAQYILDSVELPDPIDVTYGITLYRVQYRTTNHDGAPVVASGLVALPSGRGLNSVVMYLHGTSAYRRIAPSQSGLGEGMLMAAAAAGTGHVLVAPDYVGLGEGRGMHPYMHAKTTATTCIDFLRAAAGVVEHVHGRWPTRLYVMGFSQGGHAALVVHRELEALADPRFEVMASAPIAGPFYLREISFPQALTGEAKSHPFYLAYIANAYAAVYSQPPESILKAPYAATLPPLFDGDHEPSVIAAAMPEDPRDLFRADFLDAYSQGKSHWFLDALAENNVGNWVPRAPVRAYFGESDVDVLPEEARRAEADMKPLGADLTAICVGPYDHNGSALRAIPQALRWFTRLAAKRPADSPHVPLEVHPAAK